MPKYEKIFQEAVERQLAGDLEAAEALYRKILRGNLQNVATLNNFGVVLKERGALEEAAKALKKAVALMPDYAEAHNNLGTVLGLLGQEDDAIACYHRALKFRPNLADAHNNLGNALRGAGRYAEAESSYRKAISCDPEDIRALENLGDTLQVDGRLEEAGECYARAYALRPSDALRIKQALMLPPIYRSLAELEATRARFEANLDALLAQPIKLTDPLREVKTNAFYLPFQGFNDRDLQRRIAQVFAPSLPSQLAPARPRPGDGRIRVGFVSRNWRNHSVGSYAKGLTDYLAEAGFDVTVFGAGAVDGADRSGAAWIKVPGDLARARQAIADRNLDILVYPDIGMDPLTYYLAFTRLAPVQCVLGGHPVTTGIPAIDYFVSSDPTDSADADSHYSETLVRLDWFAAVIDRPSLPGRPKERAALGLPRVDRLYVCPMMLYKVHPAFDEALAGILSRDPEGRVVLFKDRFSENLHETLLARFRDTLGPASDRVIFLPYAQRDDFLSVLLQADVVLDTFPFAGGTTAFITFATGTPIVTLPSPYLRGRTTYAGYRAMGIMDCVAETVAEYVDLAVRLGTDAAFRARIKSKILDRNGVLYGNQDGAEAMAAFFRDVHEKARRVA